MKPKVRILDFEMGNIRSVARAFAEAGAEVEVSSDIGDGRLVLPGVGAFAEATRRLQPKWDALKEHLSSGRPLLGICLGMQLLFDRSHEHGENVGLGYFRGAVVAIPPKVTVPNMGWHQLAGMDNPFVYFAHSFAVAADANSDAIATIEHGGHWVAASCRGAVTGYQFHPEKSGPAGISLLRKWLAC